MQSIGPPGSQPIPEQEQPQQGGGGDDTRSISVVWLLAAIGLIVVGWVVLRDGESTREEEAVEAVVVEAITSSDPSACENLLTQSWLATHFHPELGQMPVERCREVTADSEDDDPAEAEVTDIIIDEQGALVSVDVSGGSVGAASMGIELIRDPGWKLDRLATVDVDRDRFLQVQREEIESADYPPDADPLMDCMVSWAEREVSAEEINAKLMSGAASTLYAEAFGACREEFRRMIFSKELIGAGTDYPAELVTCIATTLERTVSDRELMFLYDALMRHVEAGGSINDKRDAAIKRCARQATATNPVSSTTS